MQFLDRLDQAAREALDPGLLATVQDLGRFGAQQYGVPVSGAMDVWALRAANRLVGNDEGAAVLEITLAGPVLRFDGTGVIAVTGADLGACLDGQPMPSWQAVGVAAGSADVRQPAIISSPSRKASPAG